MWNWLVQNRLQKEAKKVVAWVSQNYPLVKAKNPTESDSDIFYRMIHLYSQQAGGNLSKASEKWMGMAKQCCSSIEGLCYLIGVEGNVLRGQLVLRCLQFTYYADNELYAKGFQPQSKETKETVLKALGLLVDGWEQYIKPQE